MRKNLLKYDDISNDQRKIVYEQRQIFLETQNTENIILQIIKDVNHRIFAESTIDGKINIQELSLLLHNTYFVAKETIPELINNIEELNTFIIAIYENKIKQLNFTTENSNLSQENSIISHIHRRILLLTLDEVYREHLYNLDHVRRHTP